MRKIDKIYREKNIEYAILNYLSDQVAFDYWLEDMAHLKKFLYHTYGYKSWEVKKIFNKRIMVFYKEFLRELMY